MHKRAPTPLHRAAASEGVALSLWQLPPIVDSPHTSVFPYLKLHSSELQASLEPVDAGGSMTFSVESVLGSAVVSVMVGEDAAPISMLPPTAIRSAQHRTDDSADAGLHIVSVPRLLDPRA